MSANRSRKRKLADNSLTLPPRPRLQVSDIRMYEYSPLGNGTFGEVKIARLGVTDNAASATGYSVRDRFSMAVKTIKANDDYERVTVHHEAIITSMLAKLPTPGFVKYYGIRLAQDKQRKPRPYAAIMLEACAHVRRS